MDAVGIIYALGETQSRAAIAKGPKTTLSRMENDKPLDGFLFGRDLNAV